MHSALFCNMVGATVENLVFDATCSFTGSFSGALSAAVSDQVSVINVTNKTKVIGNDAAGGLIGFVSGSARQSLLIDNCVNDGRIVNNNAYAGGFIGRIYQSQNREVIITNSINKGTITSLTSSGGFIGGIVDDLNKKTTENIRATFFEQFKQW